jgi:hypothetical protein
VKNLRFELACVLIVTAVILESSLATRTALSQEFGAPFVPPDRDARQRAIGGVDGLSPILKQAFSPSDAFEPIPSPASTDWLANHPELGIRQARTDAAGGRISSGMR